MHSTENSNKEIAMKRYSTTVIAHICAIVLLSAAAFFAFSHRMPFTGILLALFIAGLGINLYRLQMIQLRLMKQLSQNKIGRAHV